MTECIWHIAHELKSSPKDSITLLSPSLVREAGLTRVSIVWSITLFIYFFYWKGEGVNSTFFFKNPFYIKCWIQECQNKKLQIHHHHHHNNTQQIIYSKFDHMIILWYNIQTKREYKKNTIKIVLHCMTVLVSIHRAHTICFLHQNQWTVNVKYSSLHSS